MYINYYGNVDKAAIEIHMPEFLPTVNSRNSNPVFVDDLNGQQYIQYIHKKDISIECYSNVRWGSLLEPACMQRTEVDLEKNKALNCDSQPDNFET